jgi:hypothetical protein
MNTQSHILMGALFFGRKVPRIAWAGALGGLAPDIPMFAIVAFLRLTGHGFEEIFGTLYWSDWWQVCNAIGHNFLLWGAVLFMSSQMSAIGNAKLATRSRYAVAFSGSALLHSVVDFLVHRNDAHMHFWPLSQWRFVSPVSYWDSAHYGTPFGLFEASLGLTMAALLFRQFQHVAIRAMLALLIALYVAVPAFFIFNLAGA